MRDRYSLYAAYYDAASAERFAKDLAAKDWVVDLREGTTLRGFTTLAVMDFAAASAKRRAIYSGDTIIRREYWGTPQLPSTWIKTVLEKSAGMAQPLYWLLISSGYKTYRFLTVFYREFFPRHDTPTPPDMQALMDHLAEARRGAEYIRELGVVRFQHGATPLREGVAAVTDERLHDPHVALYIERNPGHVNGDELVCLTRVHSDNFTPAGRRMAR